LLWRVVAMTPDGFVEGERSLVADGGPMVFRAHASDTQSLDAVSRLPSVVRVLWFNHHIAKAQVRDGTLVLSDLRMGSEPDYSFRFAVATREGDTWRALQPPRQLKFVWKSRPGVDALWSRIWNQPSPMQ
jgi:inner membrane protein